MVFFSFFSLHAEEKVFNYFDYEWLEDLDKGELYFYITLKEGLEFEENYYVSECTEDRGIQVLVRPKEGYEFFSKEGHLLENFCIQVNVENIKDQYVVSFFVLEESFYVNTLSRDEITFSGAIKYPKIDLTKDPDFFIFYEEQSKGCITFYKKNSSFLESIRDRLRRNL